MSLHFKKRRFDAVQKQYEKYEETVTAYVGFFDSIEEREPKEALLAMDERQGRLFMAQERIESGLQIEGDIAAKLPQISLQKFNGNFSEWTPFWSNFETLVHNNRSLNDYTRMVLLRNHLDEGPKGHIQGLAEARESYGKAIRILQKQYGNKRRIIAHHIHQILQANPPTGNKTSPQVHRAHHDELNCNVLSLENQGLKAEQYSTILQPIIEWKLPRAVRIEWEKKTIEMSEDQYNTLTVKDVLKCYDTYTKSREAIESFTVYRPEENKEDAPRPQKRANMPTVNQNLATSSQAQEEVVKGMQQMQVAATREREQTGKQAKKKTWSCILCKGPHLAKDCTTRMDVKERQAKVEANNFCTNCLRPNHNEGRCRFENQCTKCTGRHHTLLHK